MTARKPALSPLVDVHGKSVEILVARSGLTQAIVAKRTRISKQSLSYIISGRNRRMRQDDRARLAKVLGVPVSRIGGEPPHTWAEVSRELAYDPGAVPAIVYGRPFPSRALLEAHALKEDLAARGVGADEGKLYARLFSVGTWRDLLARAPRSRDLWIQALVEEPDAGEFAARLAWLVRTLFEDDPRMTDNLDAVALEDLARCHALFVAIRRARGSTEGAHAAATEARAILAEVERKLPPG